jgi:hypothetical protein
MRLELVTESLAHHFPSVEQKGHVSESLWGHRERVPSIRSGAEFRR